MHTWMDLIPQDVEVELLTGAFVESPESLDQTSVFTARFQSVLSSFPFNSFLCGRRALSAGSCGFVSGQNWVPALSLWACLEEQLQEHDRFQLKREVLKEFNCFQGKFANPVFRS